MKYRVWHGESLLFETNSAARLMKYIYDLDDYERANYTLVASLEGLTETMCVGEMMKMPL